nr:HPP family protein [Thermosulfidibacter takaii]
MGIITHLVHWFFIFPSLGPSVFLVFYFPSSPMSSPKNTILGHLAGVFFGLASYKLWYFLGVGSHQNIILASSGLSMGVLGLFMIYTGILHPPAASTCLIASLGLIKGITPIIGMMASVVLVCLIGYVLNNLFGIEYPLWNNGEKVPLPKAKTVLGDVQELETDDHVESIAAKLAMRQKLDDED